ncbi:hypothetical protein [Streptosporangium roseum]|uniref:hypothetical protein n=1 Tax=Streptosporangium roseum TaxID=2001 RepID=UPI0033175FEF
MGRPVALLGVPLLGLPCWITTGPEPVEARHADDLLTLMRQVETQHPILRRSGQHAD